MVRGGETWSWIVAGSHCVSGLRVASARRVVLVACHLGSCYERFVCHLCGMIRPLVWSMVAPYLVHLWARGPTASWGPNRYSKSNFGGF